MRKKYEIFCFNNSFKHLLLLFMLSSISACGGGGGDDNNGGDDPDTTAPDTSISSGPDSLTNSTSANFSFTSTETGSSYQCSLDNAPYTDCTSPEAYTSLAEGDHAFSVRATDAAGNTDLTPAEYNWIIDITPPDTSVTSGPVNPTNSTSATFEFTSTEAGSIFQCSLDDGVYTDCTSPITYSGLAVGNYVFSVRAIDAAGNTDLTPAVFNWEIDITLIDIIPPDTNIIDGPPSLTNSTSATFEFTSTEAGSTFQCSLDGGAFADCTSPKSYAGLAEGNHAFSVQATDVAGNTDLTPAVYNWEIDVTPPDTNITSSPVNPTSSTSATFEFSSPEAGTTFQCSLDSGPYENCTSPKTYSGLAEANHTFSVGATDAAGNTDSTPAIHNWVVDITSPDTSITSSPVNPSNSTSATFEFTSTEAGSTFQCSLDGGVYTDCTSPETYSGLAEVNHTFSVRATDAAGNADLTPAVYDWLIDVLVDDIAPAPVSIVINDSAQNAIVVNALSANLIATDNVGVTAYLVTEHNATDSFNIVPPYLDPLLSDSSWVSVAETANLDTTIQFTLSQTYSLGDTVELCAWFVDAQDNISDRVCDSIVYGVSWEDGWANWYADNGVWQIGTPTAGPSSCFSGTQCAGTVLDGNYPAYTDSRLISPAIQLTSITDNEEIHLRFQHWFSYSSYDSGQVQVSVWDATTSSWGAWINEGIAVANTSGWSLKGVELTSYAGETVRLAFFHVAGRDAYNQASESTGWFIDDIEIVTKVPEFTGDFENGIGDWSAERGMWQVGLPTVGPAACYGGSTQCAGTMLAGNYHPNTDSRLVSATMTLPMVTGFEEIHLRFQHWFSYSSYDSGQVQVSVWDATTSSWGAWINEGIAVANTSGWSLKGVELTAYAGETVRLAFYHVAGRDAYNQASESTGWFIDDIEIVTKVPEFTGDFENGIGDWSAERGMWQVGLPTVGPAACYGGSTQCAGTMLAGNYHPNTDSRLVSATMTLPMVTGFEEIHLRFQHWFSYSSYDSGRVQVSVWDATTSSWGAWINEGIAVANTSGWSLKGVELTAYAGETVRLAFYHVAGRDAYNQASESTGWFIDDIEIVTKVPEFTGDFENGIGDWSAESGMWQVGLPTVGPAACYGGSTQCAGTMLAGDYHPNTDSRLVSATMTLPMVTGFEEIHLRFQHWFSYSSYDSGQVQVSVWDATTSTWGAWTSEGIPNVNTSGGWTQKDVILTSYAGETVRLAFYHVAGRDAYNQASESTGWYIDNIIITVF